MRLAFLALPLLVAIAPRPAAANQCGAQSPWLGNSELPVGCPVVLHVPAGFSTSGAQPHLSVRRGANQDIDVTGPMTMTSSTFPVVYITPDENCDEQYETRQDPYDTFTIDVTGATAGETVYANYSSGGDTVTLVAAGPCPAPVVRELYCQATVGEFSDCQAALDDEKAAGCTAAGGARGSIMLALILVPLMLRRRG